MTILLVGKSLIIYYVMGVLMALSNTGIDVYRVPTVQQHVNYQLNSTLRFLLFGMGY